MNNQRWVTWPPPPSPTVVKLWNPHCAVLIQQGHILFFTWGIPYFLFRTGAGTVRGKYHTLNEIDCEIHIQVSLFCMQDCFAFHPKDKIITGQGILRVVSYELILGVASCKLKSLFHAKNANGGVASDKHKKCTSIQNMGNIKFVPCSGTQTTHIQIEWWCQQLNQTNSRKLYSYTDFSNDSQLFCLDKAYVLHVPFCVVERRLLKMTFPQEGKNQFTI